jgi:hypothetical protein
MPADKGDRETFTVKIFTIMKYLFFTVMIAFATMVCAQNFEGKIIYKNSFVSKIPQLTDAQLTKLMGDRQEYYIMNSGYKSIVNGSYSQMQVFNPELNRIYHKLSSSDTLYWIDAGKENDPVVSHSVEKNKENILGYACDVLTIKTQDGMMTYYFSEKLKIDPELFKDHRYMNYGFIVSLTKALPLKVITENKQFRMVSVATEVIPQKLKESFFEIPAGTPTKISPF